MSAAPQPPLNMVACLNNSIEHCATSYFPSLSHIGFNSLPSKNHSLPSILKVSHNNIADNVLYSAAPYTSNNASHTSSRSPNPRARTPSEYNFVLWRIGNLGFIDKHFTRACKLNPPSNKNPKEYPVSLPVTNFVHSCSSR